MNEKYYVENTSSRVLVLEASSETDAIEVAKQIGDGFWELVGSEWEAIPTTMDVTPGLELD